MPGHPLRTQRVLAIDPTVRGYAFAVLEGLNAIIDWGVTQVAPNEKNRRSLRSIEEKIISYEPEVIVLEDCGANGSRRSARVRKLIEQVSLLAEKRRIARRRFSRSRVRAAFRFVGKPTKDAIAKAIAERFPELRPRLPRERKPWMSEDERMSIFDAVSLALTYLERRGLTLPETQAPSSEI
jgi:hypothetical protein